MYALKLFNISIPDVVLYNFFLAFLVEEEHYFMETVELQGLSYEPELQDKTSGFSIVLSTTLKTKVQSEGFITVFKIKAFLFVHLTCQDF